MDSVIEEAKRMLDTYRDDRQARDRYESWFKLLSDHVSALDTAERKGEKKEA
ncbi:hypothetical protein J9303_17925 [Bacillaceae bacterium Marseille-Q3522]|nr:hypothetical protein [Bacillaceae bacterium Marseille-Q3522]